MSDLVETYRGTIYPSWNLFATIGVTASFLKDSSRGMAAVQQNITYRRELYAGAMP